MSAKSKLKLLLLMASTALLLNPASVFTPIQAGEELFSQGALANDPLAALTNTPDAAAKAGGGKAANADRGAINAALAPSKTASDLTGKPDDMVPTVAVGPGENPFASQAVRPAAPVALSPAGPAAATASQPLQPAAAFVPPTPPAMPVAAAPSMPVAPVANPFGAPITAAAATPAASSAPQVDDSALRYYASTKDLQRLGAEMRRLKQLYPEWQPPKDLFTGEASVSEEPLWEIYKTGNFAALRARIAEMQSANPKWQPSDDLMQKLQISEARVLVYRSYDQKSWQQVISSAASTPSMLTCGEMQVLWDVGEAYARLKNYADSFELYRYILTRCDDPGLRLSTVQKASLLLPDVGAKSLLAFSRTMPDGSQEFEDIAFNPIRKDLGDFIQNGSFNGNLDPQNLKSFVDFVQRKQVVDDANLLAWYFYAQEDWQTSNDWFMQAARYQRNPKSLEGVILTLRKLDRIDDAFKVAQRFVNASPEIAKQYIEIQSARITEPKGQVALSDKDIADLEKVVTDQKSALGAQALGWNYLAKDKTLASQWFTSSISYEPNEGGVIGLAVLASRDKNYRALSSLKNDYGQKYQELSKFKVYAARAAAGPRKVSRPKPMTMMERLFGKPTT